MSHIPTDASSAEDRLGRNWLMEALVVLGILAFGYFALMLDNPPVGPAQAEAPGIAEIN